jgi:hypothetical protein
LRVAGLCAQSRSNVFHTKFIHRATNWRRFNYIEITGIIFDDVEISRVCFHVDKSFHMEFLVIIWWFNLGVVFEMNILWSVFLRVPEAIFLWKNMCWGAVFTIYRKTIITGTQVEGL